MFHMYPSITYSPLQLSYMDYSLEAFPTLTTDHIIYACQLVSTQRVYKRLLVGGVCSMTAY